VSYEAWGEPPDLPCDVCGAYDDRCVCPECPACGAIGDPRCYVEHGMERTEEQIQSAIVHDPANDPHDYEWPDP
jgi:hypothetical protein